MYIDRINYVKEYLRKNDIDAYIVFISDDHGSEYISDRYKSGSNVIKLGKYDSIHSI